MSVVAVVVAVPLVVVAVVVLRLVPTVVAVVAVVAQVLARPKRLLVAQLQVIALMQREETPVLAVPARLQLPAPMAQMARS